MRSNVQRCGYRAHARQPAAKRILRSVTGRGAVEAADGKCLRKCLLWFRFPAIIERFSGSEPPDFKDYSMVIIRLARGGSKKRPFYNIVATDSRSRRDGRFIERVGFYNPVATKGESLRIAQDRLTYWQGVGAQLSPTVERLVKQAQKAQPAA